MGKAAKFLLLLAGRFVGLLNQYSGAAAAYSLRNLSSSTTNVVKVRRSGDDAELDFTASEVSDGTLAAWVVAGGGTEDGFVTTWYDQSGNGNNGTQTTAANQPKIVSSGTLVTENGKAAMELDGVNDHLFTGITENYVNTYSEIVVAKSTTTNAFSALVSHNYITDTGGYLGTRTNGTNWGTFDASEKIFGAITGNLDLVTRFGDGTNISNFVNTVAGAVYSSTTQTTPNLIGAFRVNLSHFEGAVSELIIYPSDQSANRTGIEANINDYYNIY